MYKPYSGALMHIEVNFNKMENKYGFEWDIHNSNYMFNVVTIEKSSTITTKIVLALGNECY